MLYIGFFSFVKEEGNKTKHGIFTYFAQADNSEKASEIFEAGIRKAHKKEKGFLMGSIYLEGIAELKKLPKEGALLFFKEYSGDILGSIDSTLPLNESGINIYRWYPDGEEPDYEKDVEEVKPFLAFPAKGRKPKTKVKGKALPSNVIPFEKVRKYKPKKSK